VLRVRAEERQAIVGLGECASPSVCGGDRELRQELARRLGTTPQSVNRIVTLRHPTKIDTIAEALRALGRRLELSVAEG
jgi:antitoxin HicB